MDDGCLLTPIILPELLESICLHSGRKRFWKFRTVEEITVLHLLLRIQSMLSQEHALVFQLTGNKDVPISTYKENFQGTITFVKVDKDHGDMDVAFQIMMPPFDFDLSHCGKGPSTGWFFFSCYNTEQAHTLLEANASQNDKDFIVAVNWKLAEKYLAEGKAKDFPGDYYSNRYDDKSIQRHRQLGNRPKCFIRKIVRI